MGQFTTLHLLLSTFIIAKVSANPSATVLATIPTINKHESAYPVEGLLDDHQFASLMGVRNSFLQLTRQSLQLIGPNNTRQECGLPRVNVRWPPLARRLSHKSVLVLVKGQQDDEYGEKKVNLLLINTYNCKYGFAYHRELPANIQISSSENSSEERFAAVVHGKGYCDGHDWCRLHFDPLFRELEPLHFEFPSGSRLIKIEPLTSFDANRFAVRFFDKEGTRTIRQYDLSDDRTGPLYREVFSIARDATSEVVTVNGVFLDYLNAIWFSAASSDLSDCWRSGESSSTVLCSRFREDGNLMFYKSIDYPYVVRPLGLATIPNGLILFSTKENCLRDECSIAEVAVVTSSSTMQRRKSARVEHLQYDMKCNTNFSFRSLKVRENESNGTFDVQYLCQGSENYIYGIFSINK